MRKKNIKKPITKVHAFRCTENEYSRLTSLANECGLSLNRYMVEVALKHHPRQRLTKEEVDALNSLTLARADLVKISNLLRQKTDEEKVRYFRSERFMRWWTDSVAELIQHWYSIEENISSSVQSKEKEEA